MTFAPMDPATVMFVLSMTEGRWSHKARIVAYVGSFHGGAWIADSDVSEAVGRARGRCWKLLGELEDDRVLLRRLQAGRRPGWCEVNPDVAAWRNVAWAHDEATIEARLALHEKRLRDSSTALERLVSRRIGATQADLVARLIGARLAPDEGALCSPNAARDNGAAFRASRAAMARATSNSLSRAHGRATTAPRREVVPTHDQSTNLIGSGACGEPANEVVEAAKRAVLRVALPDPRGRRWVNGQPLARLKVLLLSHPLDKLEAMLEDAPADQYVPGVVEWLADNIDLPEPELPPPAPPPLPDCATCGNDRWVPGPDGVVRCPACATCDNGYVTVGEDR